MAKRKRKRSSGSRPSGAGGTATRPRTPAPDRPAAAPDPRGGGGAMKRGYARAEEKNVAAREALEPIGPENRPRIVLIACGWLGLMALSVVVSAITASGDDAAGQRAGNTIALVVLIAAIVGTYRLRPWAVLGAQTIFALATVFTVLAAAIIDKVLIAILLVAAAVVTGWIFMKMVNVTARIQKAELIRRGEIPPPGGGAS